jgi:hypothetical protein
MSSIFGGRRIELVEGSRTLRVRVNPRPAGFAILLMLAFDTFYVLALIHFWPMIPLSLRLWLVIFLDFGVFQSLYQYFGIEILEFDERKLAIRKVVPGWNESANTTFGSAGGSNGMRAVAAIRT